MTLIAELERLRCGKKLRYTDLADRCDLNARTLTSAFYRKQTKYVYQHLDALAAALGADADELREKYPQPQKQPKRAIRATCKVRNSRGHRYDQILQAIADGQTDEQIMRAWPDMTGDVLMVYHKIADGRLCQRAKNGGMYDRHDTAAAEFCAIAFRTGSLRGMTDNYDTYDGVGRW